MINSLGFHIPNSDYVFQCKKVKVVDDIVFVVSKDNEIITYSREDDAVTHTSLLVKKFILLTRMQDRTDICDVFIMNSAHNLMDSVSQVIISITENLIIHYWNINDGLCFSKVNLSSLRNPNDGALLEVHDINKRFLLVMFAKKSLLFDSYSHLICKEESFSFTIHKIYKIKDNKFFLFSEINGTYFLEISNITSVLENDFNYDNVRYRTIKQTFRIDKCFNDDTIHKLFHQQHFIAHNLNLTLKVSFLDSVEELTELTCMDTTGKFKMIFLDKILINDEEFLVTISKDLTCELFIYDKNLRDIKRQKKFTIMIEDEFLNMNYVSGRNILIGYTENVMQIFDLRRFVHSDEKYVDRTIDFKNIFGRSSKGLFFTNYFRDNFPEYISNVFDSIWESESKVAHDYFKSEDTDKQPKRRESFSRFSSNSLLNQAKFKVTASAILSHPEHKSIYYIIGTNTGKVAIMDMFFTESFKLTPLILMDYHTNKIESFTIFESRLLISSSIDGVITFTDVSNQQLQAGINKLMVNETNFISSFNIENIPQVLQKRDSGGMSMSININETDHSKYYYSKRKSLINKNIEGEVIINENDDQGKFKTITLLPVHTIKNFNKLRRILPVTQLDHNYMTLDEMCRRKNNNMLAFELVDNSVFILSMDSFKTLYRFNQHSSKYQMRTIYHISYEKCFVFYLDNDTIRICNYATRTCDRYVTDLNKIYSILRVEEKLKIYFMESADVKNLVSQVKLKYDENAFNKKSGNEYSSINMASTRNKDKSSYSKYISDLSVEYIQKFLTDPNNKKIFIMKYLHNVICYHQRLNVTLNKFEAIWMNKCENFIIDDIIQIVNDPLINDKLKKIKIMNLLFSPQTQCKINDRYDSNLHGIEGNIIKLGNQLNEVLAIRYEDFFMHVEKIAHDQKFGGANNIQFRNNYLNYLSLLHIWNLSLDQDIGFVNMLKIYQPIFDVSFMLIGVDSSCSVILNEEGDCDGDFSEHFNFFMEYYYEQSRRLSGGEENGGGNVVDRTSRFLNRKYIVNRQCGYLVNMKNFKCSSNLSHYLNVFLFGSLIAALGFEEGSAMCKLINSEKVILRSLAQQNYIKFSNLNIMEKFMYECIDDLTLANKDILLVDYLAMEYTLSVAQLNSTLLNNDTTLSPHSTIFISLINDIANYITGMYSFLFKINNDDIYIDFYTLSKENNLEPSSYLNILTDFELYLTTLVITYNAIAQEKDKIEEKKMIKITQFLVLFIFKILNDPGLKVSYSKSIVELLGKTTEYLDIIYVENQMNYAKFLVEMYTSMKIPIDLEGLFKKYEIGCCTIIKAEDNFNFLKIMLAKLIKNFAKTKVNAMLKLIVDQFQKSQTVDLDYYSYLLEILWLLFRERSARHVQYLPALISIIMTTMSPQKKEMKHVCLENAKKVLSCLLLNYSLIAFHQSSQKLAVGSTEGKIYIYDLNSGKVWRTLNAHSSEVSALSFDFSGNILVTYSARESIAKFWKIGATNIIYKIFSSQDGYYKQQKFKQISNEVSPDEKIKIVKFQLMQKNDNKLLLIREDASVEVISL